MAKSNVVSKLRRGDTTGRANANAAADADES